MNVWWNHVLRETCPLVRGRGCCLGLAFDFVVLECTGKKKCLNKAEATVLKDPLTKMPLIVLFCVACPAGEPQTANPG